MAEQVALNRLDAGSSPASAPPIYGGAANAAPPSCRQEDAMRQSIREITQETTLRELYATLQGRHRPEEVSALVLRLLNRDLDRDTRRVLARAAQGGGWGSLMAVDFAAPSLPTDAMQRLAALLFGEDVVARDNATPEDLRALLDDARTRLGMVAGRTSFKYDRDNRQSRATFGMDYSRRRYNKLFRMVARLEQESLDFQRQHRLFQLGRFGKTSFAAQIPFESFAADHRTAAAVAYLTANMGRRSIFTNGTQARAFDSVAERLLAQCAGAPPAGWLAVAHIFPRADVLDQVSAADRLHLLGLTLAVLREAAELLRIAWARTDIDLTTMIVRRGNDSSTWNALAGAWNKARDIWIALMQSLGHAATFEHFLPGKVLRLMAADVAAWHQLSGGEIHPDTRVWVELPYPWDVMDGQAICTRAQIEAACRAAHVDPETSGWTAPRAHTTAAAWQPTPELVHGVTVNQPELAYWLRKVGVFSGQGVNLEKLVTFPESNAGAA